MLFNSYEFIFIFLPTVLLGFHILGSLEHHRAVLVWLVGASLFFYAWWDPIYVGLILSSIVFNYLLGIALNNHHGRGLPGRLAPRLQLGLGITCNLAILGYFKYANFFVENYILATGDFIFMERIALPLAISFFTLQQVACLVEAYRGETRQYDFLRYMLFVSFFPQLIAGPIVYHREVLPQFAKHGLSRLRAEHLAVGMTIFSIGLFKKVVLADGVADYATSVFEAAEQGASLTLFMAWGGALAYTFQLYYDFSGYSDMAIGLARLFGIYLPLNFNAPYQAPTLIEFWRRWHITLSRFLRDYLYISLGGNRMGLTRSFINIMVTMLLGGLWHGAQWTFVVWGALHGIGIVINHGWQVLRSALGLHLSRPSLLGLGLSRILTFTVVVVGWVLFRAESFHGAATMLRAMAGANGAFAPDADVIRDSWSATLHALWSDVGNLVFTTADGSPPLTFGPAVWIVFLALLSWFGPSTHQLLRRYTPALDTAGDDTLANPRPALQWNPSPAWALTTAVVFTIALCNLTQVREFLYFQF